MSEPTPERAEEIEASWRQSLIQGHRVQRFGRRLMCRLPGPPRCKICNNPFGGFGGHVCRLIGMTPSRKNPRICALCCEKLPVGGAEIEVAVLFADVRGSTALAEKLGAMKFTNQLNRFYRTATDVLLRQDATIDKLIGDEVMAFFIPGFAGPRYVNKAVRAGHELLTRLGYGRQGEKPWLPVGVGVEVGRAFVGNVGSEDYVDFTVLGDPVNVAARFQSAAQAGEMLLGEGAYAAVRDLYPDSVPRDLEVEGKAQPIPVHSVMVGAETQPRR